VAGVLYVRLKITTHMKPILITLLCCLLSSLSFGEKQEQKSKNITIIVLGSVDKPGIYEVPDWSTLFEALAKAGGRKQYASSHAYVIRQLEDGSVKTSRFSLKDLHKIDGGIITPTLQDRDRIYIPASNY
jgi:protein involved in polysaccharide export with SLBB domain